MDDDVSVREALPSLVREFGYDADAYGSAEAYLASDRIDRTHCLVLDIDLPGMSGVDLHYSLAARGRRVPIVFITGHDDATVCRQLRGLRAVQCLMKPFCDTELQQAILQALNPP